MDNTTVESDTPALDNMDNAAVELDGLDEDLQALFDFTDSDEEDVSPPCQPCGPCIRMCGLLGRLRDYIVLLNHDGELEIAVNTFPANLLNYWNLKSETLLYRPYPTPAYNSEKYCQCLRRARLHPQTGKCSVIVIALSFAYHTSNMSGVSTLHDDIILQMEHNYTVWKNFVTNKKPSVMKDVELAKVARYEQVLSHNRRMYY
tara:strand:+ start:1254 stop:1862 length:609 start_codon:yes stop_codon:yes gene_type:complete